jgi:predicted DNA binding CopG/RHH family protein
MEVEFMKKTKLDALEQQIEDDASAYAPVQGEGRVRIEKAIYAANKTKSINVRISEYDLQRIREQSAADGVPYQTLITSIVHRYLDGSLVDTHSVRKAMQLLKS